MNDIFLAPLTQYEKEDIVRRAITSPVNWVNPFPDLALFELNTAEKNLREILQDIRLAKIDYRMKEAEMRNRDRY